MQHEPNSQSSHNLLCGSQTTDYIFLFLTLIPFFFTLYLNQKEFQKFDDNQNTFVHNDRPCILLGTRYNLTIHQIQSEFRPFFFCDQTTSTNEVYNRTSEDKFIHWYFLKIPWPFHILFHIFSEVFLLTSRPRVFKRWIALSNVWATGARIISVPK